MHSWNNNLTYYSHIMQLVSSKFKILHPIWTSISRLLMKLLVLAYFGLLGNRAGTTVCVCVCGKWWTNGFCFQTWFCNTTSIATAPMLYMYSECIEQRLRRGRLWKPWRIRGLITTRLSLRTWRDTRATAVSHEQSKNAANCVQNAHWYIRAGWLYKKLRSWE